MEHSEKIEAEAGAEIERCHGEMVYGVENKIPGQPDIIFHNASCSESMVDWLLPGFDPCQLVIHQFYSEEAALAAGWICTSDEMFCPPDQEFVWMCPYCASVNRPIDMVMPDDWVPPMPDLMGPALVEHLADVFDERLHDDLAHSFGTVTAENTTLTFEKLMEQVKLYNLAMKGIFYER